MSISEHPPCDDPLLLREWQALVDITPTAAHQVLMQLTDEDVRQLVGTFYGYMLSDEQAHRFLSTQQVTEHLSSSMFLWLRTVLGSSQQDLATLLARQHDICLLYTSPSPRD